MYYSGVIDDSVGQLISAERWYLLKKKNKTLTLMTSSNSLNFSYLEYTRANGAKEYTSQYDFTPKYINSFQLI